MAEYIHDDDLGFHQIVIRYPCGVRDHMVISTALGTFSITSKTCNNLTQLFINFYGTTLSTFHVFKSCFIHDSTDTLIYANPIDLRKSLHISAFPSKLLNENELAITLSTQRIWVKANKPRSIFDLVYNDTKYCDVTFVFPEKVVESPSTSTEVEDDPDSDGPSSPTDNKKETDGNHSAVEPSSATDKPDSDKASTTTDEKEETKGNHNSYVPSSETNDMESVIMGEQTLTAHKLVLTQWPYFKLMFENDFAEGGSGHKKITIKDTSFAAFKVLLRYIYTEAIPVELRPDCAFENSSFNNVVTWEHIYLAAARYDIDDLCDDARTRLLHELNPKEAKDFLFRTAYLFEDLRAEVIEYIVKNCGHLVVPEGSPDIYRGHPEYTDILREMYRAL
ncbi:hypothetical protein BGZ94_000234 [Podila epigama]|nr:hypothetical protein BGZ94_000234 [Podila epigama]